MRKTFGMNTHQKAAHKVGERKTSATEIGEHLVMACSPDANKRLQAVEHLCPCHVRRRIPEVWATLYKLMEDPDRRVRQAAWHTFEDGGKPSDEAAVAHLQTLAKRETDPKVAKFARFTLDKVLGPSADRELAVMRLVGREIRRRGKCDFCGVGNVAVEWDLQTVIPSADGDRAASICAACAKIL